MLAVPASAEVWGRGGLHSAPWQSESTASVGQRGSPRIGIGTQASILRPPGMPVASAHSASPSTSGLNYSSTALAELRFQQSKVWAWRLPDTDRSRH